MWFEDCGGHLGYWNKMILAILNLYVAPMSPMKLWLNTTRFGRKCHSKNFKIAAVVAILNI